MLKQIYYAGIGSRETPRQVLEAFESIAQWLGKQNCILRSGGAEGADSAFERGCDAVHGPKEIFLPWKGFNGSKSTLIVSDSQAFEIAAKYHPYWPHLNQGAQKLQARNSHQILGQDLRTPSDFVICWTKDGSGAGGTGQAIRIANAGKIPVFDAGAYTDINEFKKVLWKYLRSILNA
jgi:hypothetical protein